MNVASFVQGLASLSWLLVLGAIGFTIFQVTRQRKVGGGVTLIVGAIVLSLVLTLLSAGIVFVQPDERGVVISALEPDGIRDNPLLPGLRWIVPVVDRVETYSIAKQNYTMSATSEEGDIVGDDSIEARTSDGQIINIDATVIYAIDPTKVVDLHINWQDRYQDGLVRPQVRGIVRDAVSQFGVEEVNSTRRDDLADTIRTELTEVFSQNGLILDSFVLRKITFSAEYTAAIEQKQIAEQEAQRAAFVVEQRQQEAEQARVQAQGEADAAVIAAEGQALATVLQAEADAQALELVGQALSANPDLLEYTYVTTLSDDVQVMLVPSNSPYLFSLPDAADPGGISSSSSGSSTSRLPVPTPTLPDVDPEPEVETGTESQSP